MSYLYQGRRYGRNPNVHTPLDLSWFIRDAIVPVHQPRVVLDPCCGAGALAVPWFRESYTIGIDLQNQTDPRFNEYHQYPFELFETWTRPVPELIICNPPFCGTTEYQADNKHMMWPERFLRACCALFGCQVPMALVVPHGFRMNLQCQSKRYAWLSSRVGPRITSIITLPKDIFPNTVFCTEVLIFNIRAMEPHYWYQKS